MNKALILRHVARTYRQGEGALEVLRNINLAMDVGEMVALVGPSGSGKSTLLHIAGLLEKPDRGQVAIAHVNCTKATEEERTLLRRDNVGFVYQYHHLLPEFSALENVVVPQMIAGVSRKDARERAYELLESMGVLPRADHRPGQLSGGEQQRVAICRALANRPQLLLADEPTGNLDPHTSETVFSELLRLVQEEGLAALVATHNPDLAGKMDRRVTLRNGELETL